MSEKKPDFHARIMRMPADGMNPKRGPSIDYWAYKAGHRDARHAAAEIANEADSMVSDLLEALDECLNALNGCAVTADGEDRGAILRAQQSAREAIVKARG